MNSTFKKTTPFLIIVLGFFLLFFFGQAIPAGVLFLIGLVMVIDNIWPEKWGQDKKSC